MAGVLWVPRSADDSRALWRHQLARRACREVAHVHVMLEHSRQQLASLYARNAPWFDMREELEHFGSLKERLGGERRRARFLAMEAHEVEGTG